MRLHHLLFSVKSGLQFGVRNTNILVAGGQFIEIFLHHFATSLVQTLMSVGSACLGHTDDHCWL